MDKDLKELQQLLDETDDNQEVISTYCLRTPCIDNISVQEPPWACRSDNKIQIQDSSRPDQTLALPQESGIIFLPVQYSNLYH
jgi:hypothetical protein